MKRTTTKALLAGAALVALAGTANATDINIYGASAEFNFWKTAAGAFITHAPGAGEDEGFGCTSTIPSDGVPALNGTSHGVIVGNGCTSSLIPDGKVVIRFSSKASYDGIYAVKGSADPLADTSCGTGANLFKRKMAPEQTADNHTAGTLACAKVHVGASDVPHDSFVQYSNGLLTGTTGAVTTRSFNDNGGALTGINVDDLNAPYVSPVKVPFGFWVNNAVTAKTCATGGKIGNYCASDADCTDRSGSGTCGAAAPITNMTREMAVLLFSGQIKNWSDFGPAFTANPVVLCMRHAGSGTHATLDLAVMNNGAWGQPTVTEKVDPATPFSPRTLFYDSSSSIPGCLANTGAVGYMDADAAAVAGATGPLKYNGQYPSAAAIKAGVYDYYGDQAVYFPNDIDDTTLAAATALLNFVNSDAGLQAAGYYSYWAATSSMGVTKDFEIAYPHK